MLFTADRPTTSRWAPLFGANAPIRSGRSSKARTEADTSSARHPRREVRSLSSQASVQPSSLRRPSPAQTTQVNTGIAIRASSAAELQTSRHRDVAYEQQRNQSRPDHKSARPVKYVGAPSDLRPVGGPGWRLLLRVQAGVSPESCSSSGPAARSRRRGWPLAHTSESQVRLQVVADQAGSKHTGDSRGRDEGGQPVWPITTPDRRGYGDAHLWRMSGHGHHSGESPALRSMRYFCNPRLGQRPTVRCLFLLVVLRGTGLVELVPVPDAVTIGFDIAGLVS